MIAFIIDTVLYFILILIIFFVIKMLFNSITIYQYERGIKFHKGKFQGVMEPGKYTYFTPSTKIEVFDMDPLFYR
jgi:regulator of protease activity HflC (stomatin/prohibitin superfamily)